MSLEKITERIIAEVRQEEKELIAEAEAQAEDILKRADQKVAEIRRQAEEKAAADARMLLERQTLAARLEGRKMDLAARQKLIAESIESAMEELTSLPDEEYAGLLAEMIGESAAKGGEIVMNAVDRKRIGKRLVELLNAQNPAQPVTLAEETVQTKGGLILRQGAVAVNATFEVIIDTYDNAVQRDAAEALFGQEG